MPAPSVHPTDAGIIFVFYFSFSLTRSSAIMGYGKK